MNIINAAARTAYSPLISRCRRAAVMRSLAGVHRNNTASVSSSSSSPTACFSSIASQHQQMPQSIPCPSSSSLLSPHNPATAVSINNNIDVSLVYDTDTTNDNDNDSNDSIILDDEKSKTIRNIQDFIDQIPDAVNLRKTENIEPGAVNDPVARLFRQSEIPADAWQKYAIFDDEKPYTRNLISTDGETYTLLLLCWNPQNESPIHDHPCDGCWLQVVQGGIREVRYDKQLNCVATLDYTTVGELSYITDNVGYHKVGNTTQNPSITLHLYAPPFESCQCWYSDKANPLEPSEGRNINHSEYGVKVDY